MHRLVFHLQVEGAAGWRYLRIGYWDSVSVFEETSRLLNGDDIHLIDTLKGAHTWYRRGASTSFDRVAKVLSDFYPVQQVASCGGCVVEVKPYVTRKVVKRV